MDFRENPIEWGICLGWELIKTRLHFVWDTENTEVFQNSPLENFMSSERILEEFKINLQNKESVPDWNENLLEAILDGFKETNFETFKVIKLGQFGFLINLMSHLKKLGTVSTIPHYLSCKENAIKSIRVLSNQFEGKIFFDHFNKLTPFDNIAFSEHVMRFLETRDKILASDLVKPIYDRTQDYENSLNSAWRLQCSQIPSEQFLKTKFKDVFFILEPKVTIGGDFVFYQEESDFLYLACCDCTGHGIPGALLTINANKTIYDIIARTKLFNPSLIIKQLSKDLFLYNNRLINVKSPLKEYSYLSLNQIEIKKSLKNDIEETSDLNLLNWRFNEGLDISMIVKDNKNSKIYISGTNGKIYINKNGKVDVIKTSKYNIGDYANYQDVDIDEYCIDYAKNDDITIIMFSDGFESQFGGSSNKKVKSKSFLSILQFLLEYTKSDFSLFKILLRAFMLLWRDFEYSNSLYYQYLHPNKYESDIDMTLNLVLDMHKAQRLDIDNLEKFTIDKNEQVDDITVIGIKI